MAAEQGFYVSAGTHDDEEKNYKVAHHYRSHQFDIAWKVYQECSDYLWRTFEYVDADGKEYAFCPKMGDE